MPLVSKNVERMTPGNKEDLDMFLSKYGVNGVLNAICIRLFEEQSTLEANGKDPSDFTRRRRLIETAMFEMRKLPESFDPLDWKDVPNLPDGSAIAKAYAYFCPKAPAVAESDTYVDPSF